MAGSTNSTEFTVVQRKSRKSKSKPDSGRNTSTSDSSRRGGRGRGESVRVVASDGRLFKSGRGRALVRTHAMKDISNRSGRGCGRGQGTPEGARGKDESLRDIMGGGSLTSGTEPRSPLVPRVLATDLVDDSKDGSPVSNVWERKIAWAKPTVSPPQTKGPALLTTTTEQRSPVSVDAWASPLSTKASGTGSSGSCTTRVVDSSRGTEAKGEESKKDDAEEVSSVVTTDKKKSWASRLLKKDASVPTASVTSGSASASKDGETDSEDEEEKGVAVVEPPVARRTLLKAALLAPGEDDIDIYKTPQGKIRRSTGSGSGSTSSGTSTVFSDESMNSRGRTSSVPDSPHYTEGIRSRSRLAQSVLVHFDESKEARELAGLVLDGIRREVGGELTEAEAQKTVGFLCLEDNLSGPTLTLSMSGSEGSGTTEKFNPILLDVAAAISNSSRGQHLISVVAKHRVVLQPRFSLSTMAEDFPDLRGAKTPPRIKHKIEFKMESPKRVLKPGAARKATNQFLDFLFVRLHHEYHDPASPFRAKIVAGITQNDREVVRKVGLEGATQETFESLYPEETAACDSRKSWITKYNELKLIDPLLPLVLNNANCAENDLWEGAVKAIVNKAQSYKIEGGVRSAERPRGASLSMGMFVTALTPDTGRVRYSMTSLAGASGEAIIEREACSRCDIFQIAFDTIIAAINSGSIRMEDLINLAKPSPEHIGGGGGSAGAPSTSDSSNGSHRSAKGAAKDKRVVKGSRSFSKMSMVSSPLLRSPDRKERSSSLVPELNRSVRRSDGNHRAMMGVVSPEELLRCGLTEEDVAELTPPHWDAAGGGLDLSFLRRSP